MQGIPQYLYRVLSGQFWGFFRHLGAIRCTDDEFDTEQSKFTLIGAGVHRE